MIAHAKQKHPEGEFRIGSMLELPVPTSSWIGAVSIYATLHSDQEERRLAFHELKRVIRAGGYLMHSFFISAPDHPRYIIAKRRQCPLTALRPCIGIAPRQREPQSRRNLHRDAKGAER